MAEKNSRDGFPVSITERAIEQIKLLKLLHNIPKDEVYRIGTKPGRCSLFLYAIGFDKEKEHDIIKEIAGIRFAVSPAHVMYIEGMEVDWKDTIGHRGFVFNKPE